jgi:uncharacterized membrane protein YraQ (UPF0718 family)
MHSDAPLLMGTMNSDAPLMGTMTFPMTSRTVRLTAFWVSLATLLASSRCYLLLVAEVRTARVAALLHQASNADQTSRSHSRNPSDVPLMGTMTWDDALTGTTTSDAPLMGTVALDEEALVRVARSLARLNPSST